MISQIKIKLILFKLTGLFLILINLNSCGIYRPVSAKDYPPEPEKRVKKNLEEGRGFTIMGQMNKKGGDFEFATSNEMWRASLDILDFMPLTSADYGRRINYYWLGIVNKVVITIQSKYRLDFYLMKLEQMP